MQQKSKRNKKPYFYRFIKYNIKYLLLIFVPNEKGGNSI